jgi:hypothetical protein
MKNQRLNFVNSFCFVKNYQPTFDTTVFNLILNLKI